MRIVLGVSGGIAAYKAAEIARSLTRNGHEVQAVLTRAAEEFIRPLTFAALTGHPVLGSLWQPDPAAQLTEVANNLKGVTPQSSTLSINPENWYFVK